MLNLNTMTGSILLSVALAAGSLFGQAKTTEPPKAATTQTTPAKKAPAVAKEVPAAERCIAKTDDGDQCKRRASKGKKFCWQHDPNRKKGKGKATVAAKS